MKRPGGGASAGGGEGAYSWDRSFRLWDTYFALIWLATLVFVLGTGHPGWPVRLTSAAPFSGRIRPTRARRSPISVRWWRCSCPRRSWWARPG